MIIQQSWHRSLLLSIAPLVACGTIRAESYSMRGPECLYTALVALDANPGPYAGFLERIGDVDPRSTSLHRLGELAEEFGMSTLTVQTTLENLKRRQKGQPFACIAHMDGDHFVVIGEVQPNSVWIVNPPSEGMVATPVFGQRWSGNALLIAPSPLVAEEDIPKDSFASLTIILVAAIAVLLLLLVSHRMWSASRQE